MTWRVTFLPERKLSPPQRISVPQAVGLSASGGQLHRAWEMKPCALISVLLETSFSSCGANLRGIRIWGVGKQKRLLPGQRKLVYFELSSAQKSETITLPSTLETCQSLEALL